MEENTERVKDLVLELNSIISELKDMCVFFSTQATVSHLSQSKWQWQGGIMGAIREYKEDKRLLKIMNTPLYNGKSYYQLCFHIISKTDEMVEKQQEIQSLTDKSDELYYDGVKKIFSIVIESIKAWHDYAPDVAQASITIGEEKGVALLPTVEGWTKDAIKKLDLPDGMIIHEYKPREDNSGCLGVIAFLIVCGGALFALL